MTEQWIAAMQIGDGAMVMGREDGSVRMLTVPDHGEYINEASFVTDSDYVKHAQYVAVPRSDIWGIALMTDGLQILALDLATNTPHLPFFSPLFAFAARPDATTEELTAELIDFLESERVCARTEDDKTLVLAVRS